eukprot:8787757-Pyramimonas_sp.AAC.1
MLKPIGRPIPCPGAAATAARRVAANRPGGAEEVNALEFFLATGENALICMAPRADAGDDRAQM